MSPTSTMKENPLQYRVRGTPVPTTQTRGTNYPKSTEKPTKQQYSFEIKKEVVQRHLSGETAMDLAREFGLSSEHLVGGWSRKWRKGGDEALKPKPKGRPKGSGTPKPLSEEAKLRRQIARLEAENAYLKKLRDLRNQGHA